MFCTTIEKAHPLDAIERITLWHANGRACLNEAESKEILRHYDVPVVAEAIAAGEPEAVEKAGRIGFPLVLKALGANLTHKTERGLVRINLQSVEELRQAYRQLQSAAGQDWEGCLIQPLIAGRREFVAGVTRDPQFGPVVMFGLGGIFAEALGDVVFRIAPLDRTQALQMMEELSTRKLLADFRGEAAADMEQLARVLVGLSQLALENPSIKEVDVNPLIISPNGRATAVDALVVLDDTPAAGRSVLPEETDDPERVAGINAALEAMTHPRAIAVVGVGRTRISAFPGIFRCVRNFGFPGRLYPINPKADDIDGIKAYPSLCALPEPVDLVILSVPAQAVPEALEDCVASGNKNVHIFTSGFSETAEEEGVRLQEQIKRIADEGGLNIIGPNCMGLHVPASRLLTWTAASNISGPVAMISQSGGNAQDFSNYAVNRFGLHFSKVISYGNALTLDSTDFLAYLAEDEETRIIAMYLEGVKNGRLLLRQVTEINRAKPIVILKGGLTESGARTVASHTGSLAGGEKIWRAFFRQTGAVAVDSLEEMADVIMALHHLPACTGRGVAILGTGGGIGVAAADSCAKAGLHLPALPPELMRRLRAYIPPAGNMIRNPIDAHIMLTNLDLLGPTLQLLAGQSDLHMFIVSLHLDWLYGLEQGRHIEKIGAYIAQEARRYTSGKPIVVVWRQYQPNEGIKNARKSLERILIEGGVPVYEGLDRAVGALARTAGYHMFQAGRTA
ncbi:MAG: CoA-binding protein [Desulfobacteraceae bacterium]|nr:MAG: CoA-binding protein [Desulfobacteraceae bacterium]